MVYADGFALLSLDEQKLCSEIKILPRPYLAIKDNMVRETARRGGLMTKKEAVYVGSMMWLSVLIDSLIDNTIYIAFVSLFSFSVSCLISIRAKQRGYSSFSRVTG